MLSFAKKNIHQFRNKEFIYPLIFGFCKYISGFAAAVTNTIILMQQEDVVDAIKDFISVSIIFEVDNILAGTISKDTCSAMYVIDDDNFQFDINRHTDAMTDYEILYYNNPGQNDDADQIIDKGTVEERTINSNKLTCFQFTVLLLVVFLTRILNIIYQVIYFYFMPLIVLIIFFLKMRGDLTEARKTALTASKAKTNTTGK